jgi:hypothetical protein
MRQVIPKEGEKEQVKKKWLQRKPRTSIKTMQAFLEPLFSNAGTVRNDCTRDSTACTYHGPARAPDPFCQGFVIVSCHPVYPVQSSLSLLFDLETLSHGPNDRRAHRLASVASL